MKPLVFLRGLYVPRQRDRSEPVPCPLPNAGSPAIACVLGAILACSSVARAQSADFVDGRGLDPRLVRPISDDFGFLGVESASGLERGEFGAVVSASDALSVLKLGAPLGEPLDDRAPLIDDAVTTSFGLQLGLLERGDSALSVAASLPVHVLEGEANVIEGSYNAAASPLRSEGLGAPSLQLKWAPWSSRHRAFGAALIVSGDAGVAGALRSDPGVTLWPRAAMEWRSSRFTLALNAGYRLLTGRGPWLADGIRYDDQLTLGAGARVTVIGPIELGAELHAAQLVRDVGEERALSSELDLGARIALGQAHVMLAGGVGLGDGVLEPDGRVMLIVSMRGPRRDPDGDRYFGDADRCPRHAEDFDLHEDADGCPEPDNDGDGVLDARDACPDDAGDLAAQGCPQRSAQ